MSAGWPGAWDLDLVALQIQLATVEAGAAPAACIIQFLEAAATAAAQHVAGGITKGERK